MLSLCDTYFDIICIEYFYIEIIMEFYGTHIFELDFVTCPLHHTFFDTAIAWYGTLHDQRDVERLLKLAGTNEPSPEDGNLQGFGSGRKASSPLLMEHHLLMRAFVRL